MCEIRHLLRADVLDFVSNDLLWLEIWFFSEQRWSCYSLNLFKTENKVLLCVFIETDFWWEITCLRLKQLMCMFCFPCCSLISWLSSWVKQRCSHNTPQDPLAKKIHVGFGWDWANGSVALNCQLGLNHDEWKYKPVDLRCCCLLGREDHTMGFHLEWGCLFSLESFERSLKEKDAALKTVKYYNMLAQLIFSFNFWMKKLNWNALKPQSVF